MYKHIKIKSYYLASMIWNILSIKLNIWVDIFVHDADLTTATDRAMLVS